MEDTKYVEVEFVVVEPDDEFVLDVRANAMVRSPLIIGTDNGLTVEEAWTKLASLMQAPLNSVSIIEKVGRCYLLEYQPLQKPDPDIVFCDWPGARPINSTILDMQEARAVRWRNWNEFWDGMDYYVKALKKLLKHSSATGEERAFVLHWAQRVRDTGAAIVDPRRAEWAEYY